MSSYVLPVVFLAFLAVSPNSEGRKYLQSFAGPYWVKMQRVYTCPQEESQYTWINCTIRLHNIPKTHLEPQRVSAVMGFGQDLTDDVLIAINFSVWANNHWTENAIAPMTLPHMGCSMWKNYVPDFYHKISGRNESSRGPCVIPKGLYLLNNTVVDWKFPPFPQFIYGTYRLKVKYFMDQESSLFCFNAEGAALALPS